MRTRSKVILVVILVVAVCNAVYVGTMIGRFGVRIRTVPGPSSRKLDVCTTEMHAVWLTGMAYAEVLSRQRGSKDSQEAVLGFARMQTSMSSISAAKLLVEGDGVPQHIRDLARQYGEAALRLGAAIDAEREGVRAGIGRNAE